MSAEAPMGLCAGGRFALSTLTQVPWGEMGCGILGRDLSPLSWGELGGCEDLTEEKDVHSLRSRGLETSRFLQEARNQPGKSVGPKVPLTVHWVA